MLLRSSKSLAFEASAMIGTFLIVWLFVVPAIWLAWGVSRVPALFINLTARVRKTMPHG